MTELSDAYNTMTGTRHVIISFIATEKTPAYMIGLHVCEKDIMATDESIEASYYRIKELTTTFPETYVIYGIRPEDIEKYEDLVSKCNSKDRDERRIALQQLLEYTIGKGIMIRGATSYNEVIKE